MTYKTGEVPQVGDSVAAEIEGQPARGKVLRVSKDQKVLLERRAPYEGKHKPLKQQHDEVPSEGCSLVYRHAVAPAAPAEAPAKAKASRTKR